MNECERHHWLVHSGSGKVYCYNCDAKLGPLEVEERLNAVERLKALADAARFALDFHIYCTKDYAQLDGVDRWRREVVNKLREALAAAGYGEDE